MNDSVIRLLFLAHCAATLYMTGVIWFVQIVHYPLFASIGVAEFSSYEQRHTALTTWIVTPPMLVELATALLLIWLRPFGVSTLQVWIGLGLLVAIWISTFLLQVPCHEVLSKEFDDAVHKRLVWTNWLRTAAWSLRGLLVLWMVWSFWETH
jgi:hypothetical protein